MMLEPLKCIRCTNAEDDGIKIVLSNGDPFCLPCAFEEDIITEEQFEQMLKEPRL